MKCFTRQTGYTIIEVMMFLAISGVMFLIAGSFINGQQQATQFSQSLNDFESKVQDVVNNVATGTFPDAGTFTCNVNASSGTLSFTTGTQTQGTNQSCVFIGKALQLYPQNNPDGLNIFTVAGRRTDSAGAEVQRLDDAIPTPVAVASSITNTAGIELTDKETLRWGAKVTRVVTASSHQDVSAIGFISDFGHYGSTGTSSLLSGAQSVTLVLPLGALNQDLAGGVSVVRSIRETDRVRGNEGAIICLKSANDNRRGALKISAQGSTAVILDKLDQIVGTGVCP
jgi:type II secretory pathway pseudopilin PulG